MWLLWLTVSLLGLVIELSNGDLYVICFSIGALVSMLLAMTDSPLWLQVLVWAIASVLCIIFIRPSMLRRLHDRKERQSNADALVGQEGRVIKAIPADGYGYVKIAGDEWRSLSADGTPIPEGTAVVVIKRESIVLTVSPKAI